VTARDLLAAALRRWYVVVLGAALTVGAFAVVQRQAPVFFTQYNIVLVGPSGTEEDNNVLEHPRYGLQPLVGVISTDLNEGHPPLLTGDVDATMVGMGERAGVQVRVPNLGTQWRPLFSANYLDVQVAARTPDDVEALAAQTSARVADLLEQRQDELGVPGNLRARAVPSSEDPIVYPMAGSRSRALGATGLTGIALTAVLVFWLERWRPRRGPATAPGAAPAAEAGRRVLVRRRTRTEVLA
jgi:hypothetical protein